MLGDNVENRERENDMWCEGKYQALSTPYRATLELEMNDKFLYI